MYSVPVIENPCIFFLEQDKALEDRSDLAAGTLPAAPTAIDVRIAHAVCTGEFQVDTPGSTSLEAAIASTSAVGLPGSQPPLSPVEVALKAANGPDGKWYCVSQGTEPGIYSSW